MNDYSLPARTLRDLGILLVVVAETAWKGAKTIVRRLSPFMAPPSDLMVHSTKGAEYTGVLLIDDNDIVAGAVVCTGHEPPSRGLITPAPETAPRPPPDDSLSRRDGYLRGWSEDPRDEEGDVWWPRNQRR